MMYNLLDKLLGSDKDLKGPNLARAPWLALDFSGTKLRYRDPMHTAMFPVNTFAEDRDIYNPDGYERQKRGHLARQFYIKGWDFKGRACRGGVRLSGRLFYYENELGKNFNCFEKADFEQQIFEFCHAVWGWLNETEKVGDLGTKRYIYPIDSRDLDYLDINGTRWCYFASQAKGSPPEIEYACPLSSHHILLLYFTLQGYSGTDFYSPETNLEQVTFQYVKDFMANFYIELSDEAKAQQAVAKQPL